MFSGTPSQFVHFFVFLAVGINTSFILQFAFSGKSHSRNCAFQWRPSGHANTTGTSPAHSMNREQFSGCGNSTITLGGIPLHIVSFIGVASIVTNPINTIKAIVYFLSGKMNKW